MEAVTETLGQGAGITPRHEHGYVQVGSRFYLLGGRRIQPVDIFDPATGLWTKGAPPPIEIHHFQAVPFDNMFGEIINVAQLRLDAEAMGLTNTSAELQEGVNQARELYNQLQRIRSFKLPKQGTRGFSEFAEGGLVTQPTQALIGEAGAEVVIPLTRPARAAELMRLSGLDKMLSPAVPSVQVFIGNEQLDSRTYRIVTENNSALSSSLAFGARGL